MKKIRPADVPRAQALLDSMVAHAGTEHGFRFGPQTLHNQIVELTQLIRDAIVTGE